MKADVSGDESVKVLSNKRHNDKHDKIRNMCGGNNHDAAKCRHRSSEYANLSEKPYVGSDGHAKLVAAKGPSYTRIPYIQWVLHKLGGCRTDLAPIPSLSILHS